MDSSHSHQTLGLKVWRRNSWSCAYPMVESESVFVSIIGAKISIPEIADAWNNVKLLVDLLVEGSRQNLDLGKRVCDGVNARFCH